MPTPSTWPPTSRSRCRSSTRLHAFAQGEKTTSRQTGSQTFAAPDWTGKVDDKFEVLGFGIKHAAIPDKLDLGADLWFSRARSDISVADRRRRAAVPDGQVDARRRQALCELQGQRQDVARRKLLVRAIRPRRTGSSTACSPRRSTTCSPSATRRRATTRTWCGFRSATASSAFSRRVDLAGSMRAARVAQADASSRACALPAT